MISVGDTSDQWHGAANPVFGELQAAKVPLLTTSCVLLECGNAAARRPYRGRVNVLRQLLLAENLLFEPSDAKLAAAWLEFDRGTANQAGIVDQVSFQVMRRLGLRRAFTNDQHFLAAGFEVSW